MGYKSTYIKEVIIEKFMSYEYARIEFKPGINFIIGPNGAGKSSILIAMSIAMGLSHTERGRRLSDLIRRGEDIARVSIVLFNKAIDGKRPIPYIRSDEIIISRILRRDGQYWFEVNYKYAARADVKRILSKVGIDPDNILIIMHQNMIEAFGFIDPKEKLILFEEALGLKEYRDRIIGIREKLEKVGGEEAEIRKYLNDAEAALKDWKELYDKWIKKKELLDKLKDLEREFAWAKYNLTFKELVKLENDLDNYEDEVRDLESNLMIVRRDLNELNDEFKAVKEKLLTYIDDLYAKARYGLPEPYRDRIVKYINNIERNRMEYGRAKAEESVYLYRIEELNKLIKNIKKDIERIKSELKALESEARLYGEPLETVRALADIQSDIRDIKSLLKFYEDVDETAEDTYKYYLNLYNELKSRMERILEDKKKLEEELRYRISIWKKNLSRYVTEVSNGFNEFLKGLNASGYVRVEDIDDIDNARLELYVGFGGIEPIRLDAYSQSGGERTTAAMAFLLALQKYIKSPFRAVDEFDVHMDPKNREAILNYLIDTISREGGQYIIITPGYVGEFAKNSNIIIVQKIEGISIPRVVSNI